MKQRFSEITFKDYLNTVEKSGILVPFENNQNSDNELVNKLNDTSAKI